MIPAGPSVVKILDGFLNAEGIFSMVMLCVNVSVYDALFAVFLKVVNKFKQTIL